MGWRAELSHPLPKPGGRTELLRNNDMQNSVMNRDVVDGQGCTNEGCTCTILISAVQDAAVNVIIIYDTVQITKYVTWSAVYCRGWGSEGTASLFTQPLNWVSKYNWILHLVTFISLIFIVRTNSAPTFYWLLPNNYINSAPLYGQVHTSLVL